MTHSTVQELADKFILAWTKAGFKFSSTHILELSKLRDADDFDLYQNAFIFHQTKEDLEGVDTPESIVIDIADPPTDTDGTSVTGTTDIVTGDDGTGTAEVTTDTGSTGDTVTGETPAEMVKKLAHKKHSIKHKFGWPVALMLEPGEENELMLFKGVAMQEGEMKRGEKMDRDNLLFATGAMSTAAMMGVALMDIDHFETAEEIPESYLKKYGEGLITPYPPAFIIDAAVEENVIEPGGRKVNQVEFIGACTNRLVYDMIRTGKFKGCSVVDYFRKETCDCGADQKEDVCNKCNIEGSHFLMNTFILEEVPNSDGTWVEILTEKDVGTIIERPTASMVESLQLKSKKDPRMRMKTALLAQNKKLHSRYDLDKYMDETGQWLDGLSSITAFLVDEKSIPETTSQDMAEYLFAHPDALNQYQYENMSAEDLVAWFRHITDMAIQAELHSLKFNVSKLNILQHNADGLTALENIVQLTKEDVNYGPASDENMSCGTCRWFMEGTCAIVEGDIAAEDTCNRFEAIPGQEPPTEPGDGIDATNAEHDPVEPDADGNCPDGMELGEDGMCRTNAEHPEPVEPDGDGNCPPGWVMGDDNMCMMPEGVPEKDKMKLIKSARVFKLFTKKPKPSAIIERKPQVSRSIVLKQYEDRRDKIIKEINSIGMLIGHGVETMAKQGRLIKLRQQLHDLDHTLKKT